MKRLNSWYPTVLIRDHLTTLGVVPADQLRQVQDRTRITVAGHRHHRQRPRSAHGTTFISLADETGLTNIIVSPTVWQKHARVARTAGGLIIHGMLERGHGAVNVIAERIEKLDLGLLPTTSRDFR